MDYFKCNDNFYFSAMSWWNRAACIVIAAVLACVFSTQSSAGEFHKTSIRFAVPPWPGVIVKTEIVSDILEALGYKTVKTQLGTTLAFQSIANKDDDVYLAYWSPNMDGRAKKYLKSGAIQVLADNVNNAQWGIGVPGYVWKAGIHTVSDLADHKNRFGGKIYGIESGSVLNQKIETAIKMDAGGLGSWELVRSSTAIMLAAVKRHVDKHQWVAWGAWSPHWMMTAFQTHFLNNSTKANLRNTVIIKTVVPRGFEKFHPDVARFLKRFRIPSATQSQWIFDYKRKNEPLKKLASKWIQNNMSVIGQWLEGVQSRSGQAAIQAVRNRYQR